MSVMGIMTLQVTKQKFIAQSLPQGLGRLVSIRVATIDYGHNFRKISMVSFAPVSTNANVWIGILLHNHWLHFRSWLSGICYIHHCCFMVLPTRTGWFSDRHYNIWWLHHGKRSSRFSHGWVCCVSDICNYSVLEFGLFCPAWTIQTVLGKGQDMETMALSDFKCLIRKCPMETMSHYIFRAWRHFHVWRMPECEWCLIENVCKRDIVSSRENPSRSLYRFTGSHRLYRIVTELCLTRSSGPS